MKIALLVSLYLYLSQNRIDHVIYPIEFFFRNKFLSALLARRMNISGGHQGLPITGKIQDDAARNVQ